MPPETVNFILIMCTSWACYLDFPYVRECAQAWGRPRWRLFPSRTWCRRRLTPVRSGPGRITSLQDPVIKMLEPTGPHNSCTPNKQKTLLT